MKKMMRTNGWISATVLALVLGLPQARAQDQGLGDMVFSAATVTQDAYGQNWAWIQWMATDSSLLNGVSMDLYLKPGLPSSTAQFVLKGRAMRTTNPHSIALLLQYAVSLGEDTNKLAMAVDSLFADALPDGSLSLAGKLAAVVAGSSADESLFQNLTFLARAHPAVAMANGQGFTIRIPSGFSTIEIRNHATGRVMGRNTVQAGAPVVLPAPGPLLQIQNTSPRGNLNVRLRWDVPTDLKRVSLLQFGYNLYRMPKDYAEDASRQYNLTPPAHGQISGLVDGTNVVKVNRMPIVVDAANVVSNTWFIIDDNSCREGVDFVDGEQYYYFVSALDLLGRDGDLSAGLLAAPFDRMSPDVPQDVRVQAISDYAGGARTQWLDVSWDPPPSNSDVAAYYVYRFDSIAQMQSNAVFATSNRISGAIDATSGTTRFHYDDHGLGIADYDITYWYTVRAADNSAGGANLSGNSGPAYGTLRNWEGPAPVSNAVIYIQTESLQCSLDGTYTPALDAESNIELFCTRFSGNSRIAWAEFSYYTGGYKGAGSETNAVPLGRYWFPDGDFEVSFQTALDVSAKRNVTVFCRVGSKHGKKSSYAYTPHILPYPEENPIGLQFSGTGVLAQVPGSIGTGPHEWGSGLVISNVVVKLPPVATAKTYRLYRRVDGGRQTLIGQGKMDSILWVLVEDITGGTVNGGTICYYAQLFDVNGNASPLVKLGCIKTAPRADLPAPVLNPVDPTGSATSNPGLQLNWFCPAPAVERFEVAVALDQTALPTTFSSDLRPLEGSATNHIDVVVNGATNSLSFGFYRTGRIDGNFGDSANPLFSVSADAVLNDDYTVMVRAIGASGIPGSWSNVETFRWAAVPTAGPQVPWPTRPLPLVQQAVFNTKVSTAYLADADYSGLYGRSGVGIRIGELPPDVKPEASAEGVWINGNIDPIDFLYENRDQPGTTALPCVLYRYELPSIFYLVSGDVVQVSPLMENIAYGTEGSNSVIRDPFFAITRLRGSGNPWGIYLIDTQPVRRYAIYQYLLVRFGDDKEIDRIIPIGKITIN